MVTSLINILKSNNLVVGWETIALAEVVREAEILCKVHSINEGCDAIIEGVSYFNATKAQLILGYQIPDAVFNIVPFQANVTSALTITQDLALNKKYDLLKQEAAKLKDDVILIKSIKEAEDNLIEVLGKETVERSIGIFRLVDPKIPSYFQFVSSLVNASYLAIDHYKSRN